MDHKQNPKPGQASPHPLDPNSDAFPSSLGDLGSRPSEWTAGQVLELAAWASSRFGTLFALFGALAVNLTRHPLPATLLPLGETLRRAAMLRPSGILELGGYLLLISPVLYLLAALRRRLVARDPVSPPGNDIP